MVFINISDKLDTKLEVEQSEGWMLYFLGTSHQNFYIHEHIVALTNLIRDKCKWNTWRTMNIHLEFESSPQKQE